MHAHVAEDPSAEPKLYADKTLLTLDQAAEIMGLSYWTVSRWAARGEFCPKAVKLPNGQWRVMYADLMEWVLGLGQR